MTDIAAPNERDPEIHEALSPGLLEFSSVSRAAPSQTNHLPRATAAQADILMCRARSSLHSHERIDVRHAQHHLPRALTCVESAVCLDDRIGFDDGVDDRP
jgi:hypothetical protein